MNSIAVTSRSFSKHPLLRETLNKRYQQVTYNESGKTLTGEALIQFLKDHDMAIIGLERLDAAALQQLPRLKVVSRFGVGLDTLDLNAMKAQGVKLAYTAGANKRSVAELVIAFSIMLLRQLPQVHNELIREGVWQQRKGRQLADKCVGLVGLGAVGKETALLLTAFQCKIIAFDQLNQPEFCQAHGIEQLALEPLLQRADIVSVHLPLNAETRDILDRKRLNLLKPTAVLINTARGGLVDEQALKELLTENKIAAAAFDVFATEPPADTSLLSLANFYATPHIGGSTEEAILAMGLAAIHGLESAKPIV